MELFAAHNQWVNRPDDQRFPTLESLYIATEQYYRMARQATRPFAELRVEAVQNEVHLVGKKGLPAQISHWAFGQLTARVGAPSEYLRGLPATLACQNLNHGLALRAKASNNPEDDKAVMLFHCNGSTLLRALTTPTFQRIWNYEVAARLIDMAERDSWEPAIPDFNSQGPDKQTALYASDHDMFAFVRSTSKVIREGGPGKGGAVYRGFICGNSEVGANSLFALKFLYREMCGNHIIWGASDVSEIRLRHVGTVRDRFTALHAELSKWSDASASDDEKRIERAQTCIIASGKDGVLDAVFGKRAIGLARKTIEAGYNACIPEQDGDPRSVWGLLQGITRHSQTIAYADERTRIDRAAGKLMEVDF